MPILQTWIHNDEHNNFGEAPLHITSSTQQHNNNFWIQPSYQFLSCKMNTIPPQHIYKHPIQVEDKPRNHLYNLHKPWFTFHTCTTSFKSNLCFNTSQETNIYDNLYNKCLKLVDLMIGILIKEISIEQLNIVYNIQFIQKGDSLHSLQM